jgi:hypothetical protein
MHTFSIGQLQAGYRRYGDTELKRLQLIRRAKACPILNALNEEDAP